MTGPPPDPAEARAAELLALVATHTPAVAPSYTTDLVVRARRQRAFARPLRALGHFVSAIGGALQAVVGGRSR